MASQVTPSIPPEFSLFAPEMAIVLGSGLNSFVDALEVEHRIFYRDIPGFPASKVPGHAGCFSLARFADRKLLIAQGRVHLYEGWNAHEVTAGVRMFHALGIQKLILTNAAGSLNPNHAPGSWMLLSDHLNLTGTSPLLGGANFVDMSCVYSPEMREIFRHVAQSLTMPLHEGVYASLVGPQYETPAEIRMLRTLGADAVGMSTVLEAIQARALGMQVAAFSCLTNWGAGMSGNSLNHEEVTETGHAAAGALIQLLQSSLPSLLSDSHSID